MIYRRAPAKINLNLRIVGKAANGYHRLESLVAFVDIGDEMTISASPPPAPYPHQHHDPHSQITLHILNSIELDGAFFENNLILRAAGALLEHGDRFNIGSPNPAHITLEKNIPIGAGLGGGSSDAAVALLLLNDYWQMHLPLVTLHSIAATLGSDIAACLTPSPQWMTGTGNTLSPATIEDGQWAVLVHPGQLLASGSVYQALATTAACEDSDCQNDLTAPAIRLVPEIAEVLATIKQSRNVTNAQMSGSGSACFGLFGCKDDAEQAAQHLRQTHPTWWVAHGRLMAQ